MLLILLLLGLVLLFACHLFLTLVLILFSAFVSHCVSPFHSPFAVLHDATPRCSANTFLDFKRIPATAEGQHGIHDFMLRPECPMLKAVLISCFPLTHQETHCSETT